MIHVKYSEALELYRNTTLTQKEIALQCNVSVGGFRSYISRYHHDLLLEKYKIKGLSSKVKRRKGQEVATKIKYQDAVAACFDIKYIEYNISQIARMFKLSPSGLGNQLRLHYANLLERRYTEQESRGINTYRQSGRIKVSRDMYCKATDLLKTSELTIEEAARICNVSFSGLRQHLYFYHKDIVDSREKERLKNTRQKQVGKKNGNNTPHLPRSVTRKKYERALMLYSNTSMTIKEICKEEKISEGGFCYFLRSWHRNLMIERKGIEMCQGSTDINLNKCKHYLVSSKSKYKDAIEYLKKSHETVTAVARKFKLHPECFRSYLKEHETELSENWGTMEVPSGKSVLKRSYIKYKEAIALYQNSDCSLKEIASRLNLVYMSLGQFMRRNYPELIKQHNRNLKKK